MEKIMSRKNDHVNANVLLNMLIATFVAMFLGILLRVIGFPCWFVCGTVGVCAVVTEHFLTVYPVNAMDKIKNFYKHIKNKVLSWKN